MDDEKEQVRYIAAATVIRLRDLGEAHSQTK
jgi:hypothetical protein